MKSLAIISKKDKADAWQAGQALQAWFVPGGWRPATWKMNRTRTSRPCFRERSSSWSWEATVPF